MAAKVRERVVHADHRSILGRSLQFLLVPKHSDGVVPANTEVHTGYIAEDGSVQKGERFVLTPSASSAGRLIGTHAEFQLLPCASL